MPPHVAAATGPKRIQAPKADAIRLVVKENNPTIFIENRMLYNINEKFKINNKINRKKSRILKRGKDITIVGISYMAIEALRSRNYLKKYSIDAEIIDTIYYNLFPNFHPWAGWGDYSKIVYRFRPLKDRHDKSIMECYLLSPFNGERPTAASIKWLEEDEPWTNAPELGVLAKVFQQDSFNLPKVQKGLNNSPFEEIKLSNYQESKIRHWHDIYTNLINES